MLNPTYNLPDIEFIGGESQTLLFNLLTPRGQSFDATGCIVMFAIVNYTNKNDEPILKKKASKLMLGKEGVTSIAVVELLSEDTVDLSDRYIYQLSIKDMDGETDIPGRGILNITRNIHKSFLKE